MNATLISSFVDELEKDAVAPKLLQSLWRSGLGRSLVGGAAGAGVGALATPEDRLRGAILGGGAGALGGYASPLLTRAGRKKAWEALKFKGRKAKHELTGRGHAPVAPGAGPAEVAKVRELEQLGLTNIPGTVKGMVTHPLSTLKGAWRHSDWAGRGLAGTDLAVAAPAMLDPSSPVGAAETGIGALGSSTGYLLGGRMGLLGSLGLGTGLGYLGSRAGRLLGGTKAPQEAQALGRPTVQAARRTVAPIVGQSVPTAGRLIGPG